MSTPIRISAAVLEIGTELTCIFGSQNFATAHPSRLRIVWLTQKYFWVQNTAQSRKTTSARSKRLFNCGQKTYLTSKWEKWLTNRCAASITEQESRSCKFSVVILACACVCFFVLAFLVHFVLNDPRLQILSLSTHAYLCANVTKLNRSESHKPSGV